MPRAVNQEDSENDSSITSRMPGQTEQGVEVYKSVCDDMVAPVRENISICEDEEPVSVAQPQRNVRIIGQSVCDSVVACGPAPDRYCTKWTECWSGWSECRYPGR